MKRLALLGLCFMLLIFLVFASVVSSSILPVYAQGEYVAFPETVSISSSELVPHNFILKAISKQNGDVEKVSGFKLDTVNVISVLASDTISATSTDEVIVFEQAKVKSSTDSLFELQKTTATQGQQLNGFSLAGLAPGVYTLDIIAAKNNAKAAYEGILVIGQNPESQEVRQVIEREIIKVERDTPTTIIPVFQPPSNPQPPPGPPIILQQQQQQQPAAIPLGGLAPANPPSPPPQALAAQQLPPTPTPSPTLGAPRGTSPGSTDPVPLCTTPNGQPGRLSSKEGGGVTCAPIGGGTTPPPTDTPPDGTPCTGVDNVDIGVYKDGKCTPETLSPEPQRSPSPQALAAQPQTQCEPGFEGTPPQCTPIETGKEPADLLSLDPSSLDPSDPLFGEPGVLGQKSGNDEDTEDLADTDVGDSESELEGSDNGEGDEEEGDGEDNDSGDGGE